MRAMKKRFFLLFDRSGMMPAAPVPKPSEEG